MKRNAWKVRLDPFEEAYYSMYRVIKDRVSAMTDDELRQLLDDTSRPSQTNCGWGAFAVAPIVAEEVRGERFRRERAKAQADAAAEIAS